MWNIAGEQLTDQQLVRNILKGNPRISKEFFYKRCYPLFASTYNKYYTDCETVLEFINEIYSYILYEKKEERTPMHDNSKLGKFEFRCTITQWLKIVMENYCHYVFAKRPTIDENLANGDRKEPTDESIMANVSTLNMSDVKAILNMMPNERYRKLIQYRYLEEKTNEETAKLLDMNMANYYNKHKLAKAQFCEALRKEGLL